jgi:hypothetical protein
MSTHILNLLLIFGFGLLAVNSLLLLWFFSPLKISLGKILFKKVLMPHEFDDYISLKNNWLGELIACWICCSFWLSLIIGFVLMVMFSLPLYWPILTFLGYPCLCYLFYKKIGG